MTVPRSLLARLESQLDAVEAIAGAAPAEALDARPSPAEWSAREHLAHLARHAAVFLERLDRIRREARPALGRYRAEDDPAWPAWAGLPLPEVRQRLADARARLLAWVRALSEAEARRTGLHPTLGEMPVTGWLEFFLLHEAHHLYVAMVRAAEGRHDT